MPGVGGTWKDLDGQRELHGQQPDWRRCETSRKWRRLLRAATCRRKITVDVRGEILQLKETLNTMVEQLRSFAAEVTRVAREVGIRRASGRTGQRAWRGGHVEGFDGLGELHGRQPDRPGAKHRGSNHGGGARRLVAQNHGGRERRNSGVEEHHQHDGGPAQRVRGRSDARGARSRHGREARRTGESAGRRGNVEGSDRQRQLHGRQPDRTGTRHRESGDCGRQRRIDAETHGKREGRSGGAGRDHQQHDGYAGDVCRSGNHRGARSRRGRPAGRTSQRAGSRGNVEGLDRKRKPAGRQPHQPGARHRGSGDGGDQGRLDAFDSGGSERRSRRAERQHQHHDRQPAPDYGPQHRAGLVEDEPGAVYRHVAGAARSDDQWDA